MPEELLPHWHGCPSTDVDALDPAHDYGRACQIDGYTGQIDIADAIAVVISEEQNAACWQNVMTDSPMILQQVFAENDASIVRALRTIPQTLSVVSQAEIIVIEKPLVVFDAVMSGAENDDHGALSIDLPPGSYTVSSSIFSPDERTELVVHQFLQMKLH
jgi:hypothetical protein